MPTSRIRVIDRISSVGDHFLFVLIYIFGAVGIFVLRLFTNISSHYVLIVPISLMIVYGYIIWKTERYRLREDRAADNLYYLGFLFTVSTLIVALIRYRSSSIPDVNQIIGDLGLGLVTTVFGLVGRIFFSQLRQDPDEIEEQTRIMLMQVVDKTRSTLLATNELMADVQAQAHQMLVDAKRTVDIANKGVIESIEDLEGKIEKIDIRSDLVSARMDPIFSTLERSVNSLTLKIDAIEIAPEIFAERAKAAFKPLDVSISDLHETISSINRAFANMSSHREDIVSFVDSAEQIAKGRERLAAWATTIADNEQKLTGLSASLQDAQQSIIESSNLLKGYTATAKDQNDDYREAVKNVIAEIRSTQSGVSELANTTQVLGQEFSKAMTELVELADRAARN